MTPGAAEFLRSRRLAVALLIVAAILAASGTILASPPEESVLLPAWLLAAARFLGVIDTHRSPVFLSLVALIGLNLTFCTWRRVASLRFKGGAPAGGPRRLRLAVDVAMHLSLLAIAAGGAGKGLWGTVRTMNVHVGGATDVFFDFASGRDVPLGFTVEVLERQDTWYPLRALIGVSDSAAGAKIGLVEAVEGRTVAVPGADLSLRLEAADSAGGLLRLIAKGGGRTDAVELETVEGGKASADVGPFRLTLVAWRRDIKGVRGRIACSGDGLPRQVGWISPRERVTCGGVGFAMTAWGEDSDGRPYVGIQAVRDPAAPLFWAGCIAFVISLTLLIAIGRRVSPEQRREKNPESLLPLRDAAHPPSSGPRGPRQAEALPP